MVFEVTTEKVTAIVPGERLVMKLLHSRFLIETIYTWQDSQTGGTLMAVRERTEAPGLIRGGSE